MPLTREVYLVRHGRCERSGALLGQADVGLTEEGVSQADALAESFARLAVERVVSSDLRRAIETAERIARRAGVALETDPRLREITYGVWDGLHWEEIERSGVPAGGEAFDEFQARVKAAWEDIRNHAARVTVVVAHRGVNAVLLGDLNLEQDYGTSRRVVIE